MYCDGASKQCMGVNVLYVVVYYVNIYNYSRHVGNTLHCLTMIYPSESRSLATDFSAAP